jgi:acetoin utilization deacetylase AcuC-like enzyme
VERTKAEVAGTLLTAELALQHGLACNTAGGTHHAHAAFGSGFCILNDLAFTASVLLQRGAVQRVLILDLDVHQVRAGERLARWKMNFQHALP